jgi:hypothetical protein
MTAGTPGHMYLEERQAKWLWREGTWAGAEPSPPGMALRPESPPLPQLTLPTQPRSFSVTPDSSLSLSDMVSLCSPGWPQIHLHSTEITGRKPPRPVLFF